MAGMDRREREQILGEWGVPVTESARERRERVALDRDLEGSPLVGQPLRLRPSLRPSVESYFASLGGPLHYMVRLREIEAETAAHEEALEHAWRALAAESGNDGASFARRWRRRAERWNFEAVNELIHRHNRWYPVEARLPMDVRTGDFVLVNGRPYHRRPLDVRWVLEGFPPELALARRAA
jgi:hypothetical protein